MPTFNTSPTTIYNWCFICNLHIFFTRLYCTYRNVRSETSTSGNVQDSYMNVVTCLLRCISVLLAYYLKNYILYTCCFDNLLLHYSLQPCPAPIVVFLCLTRRANEGIVFGFSIQRSVLLFDRTVVFVTLNIYITPFLYLIHSFIFHYITD